MKFGKEFKIHLEETLPEWRDKFLCYKPLKKLLKSIPPLPNNPQLHPPPPDLHHLHHHHQQRQQQEDEEDDEDDVDVDAPPRRGGSPVPADGVAPAPAAAAGGVSGPWTVLEEWFVRILNEELDKFNDFYVDKEEDFIIRLQELKERIETVRSKSSNGAFTSESKFSEEMLEIRKAFVTIHGEMVLLKNYSSLNFAGLVKILKKYDKRTGGLLRLPFIQRALHQPFFTTEPLTRLVLQCEANLELLFPLEAEVADSSPQDQTEAHTEPSTAESSSVQEGTADVYRSTRAAMRAIQGLRRASSTYNPLSLAQFFHHEGNEDLAGTVTAENSLSNSSSTLRNEEAVQEGVRPGEHASGSPTS